MILHPKIQALRNNVGSSPIHRFFPNKEALAAVRAPAPKKPVNDSREIEQYFAIFGVPDDWGTVPVAGCFKKSLQERGPQSKGNFKIPVLWQHKQDDPLCIPTILEEDEIGLRGVYSPDPVPSGDRCVIQVRSGTVNNGSYGFNYMWDKMEYVEKTGLILIHELECYEVSPVTIGSQKETFAKRNADGTYSDEFLIDETEDLLKQIPRKFHLEIRSLIDRHISLAQTQPLEQRRKALDTGKPTKDGMNLEFLIDNFKL